MKAITAHTLDHYLLTFLKTDAHLCLIEVDQKGRILSWEGDLSHYGLPAPEAGIKLSEYLPDIASTINSRERKAMHIPYVQFKNGAPADLHIVHIDGRKGLLLFDVTTEHARTQQQQQFTNELQLLQRQHETFIRELEASREASKKSNNANKRFIAGLSSELRTPLTSVLSYSKLLRNMVGDRPDAQLYLSKIERGSQNLMFVIDNLLEQMSIETGGLEIRESPVAMTSLCNNVLELLTPLAEQKSLTLNCNFAPLFPEKIMVDGMRLRQILINLGNTAIKLTDSGSVDIDIRWASDSLEICVSDTRTGINPGEQQRVFETFLRDDHKSLEELSDTNLYLAISKQVVKKMGGSIGVAISPGKGSTFCFAVPAGIPRETEFQKNSNESGKNRRILVVTDNPDIRNLIKLALSSSGLRLLYYPDGEELVYKTLKLQPELILMDMKMGQPNCHDTVRALRGEGYCKPIIALSEPRFRSEALECGCDNFVPKPIEMDFLENAVNFMLSEHTSADEN